MITTQSESVADPEEGARGQCPPSPVQTSHLKDGRQRRTHRFHVSCPPSATRPLDAMLSRVTWDPPLALTIQERFRRPGDRLESG